MTSPIDPMRRVDPIRRARGARATDRGAEPASEDFDERTLPVPVEGRAEPPPKSGGRAAGAEFAAQLLGQDGQKRGLRAGQPLISAAKQAYDRTEWSGSKDRRSRQGRKARTEV
jgi:hypothetical protein